jgi:hypothetical protein
MAIRHVRCAIMAGLLMCGLAATAAANGRAHPATGLPEKGEVTLVGCFLREPIHNKDKYVLAQPTLGPATSVTEAACSSTGMGHLIKLEKVKKHHLEAVNLGQWIEVTGDLRKMRKDENFQDLHVTSFRPVPVVAPPVAHAMPAPEPPRAMPAPQPAPIAEAPAPAPAPAPVATTGVVEKKTHKLPHTASTLPLTALLSVVALAAGLALRVSRRQAV